MARWLLGPYAERVRAGVTLKRSVRAGIASLGIVVAAVVVAVALAALSPAQRLVVYALNPVLSGNSIEPPTVSAARSDGSRTRIGGRLAGAVARRSLGGSAVEQGVLVHFVGSN